MSEGPLQLETNACLLVFDVHEDVAWLRSVIEKERGNFDHLLLGGDYFDAFRRPSGGGATLMCATLLDLRREFGRDLTVLLGNHDISYLEVRPAVLRQRSPGMTAYTASGFSQYKAEHIARLIEARWWDDCRLFGVVNGYLVSHAGVAAAFWPHQPTVAASLAALQAQAVEAMSDLRIFHPLLGVGVPRGGNQPFGGLTWLDFNREFQDDLPLPQIFGHTPSPVGARRRGRSWCLDGGQTCYGLLRRDGSLEIRVSGRG